MENKCNPIRNSLPLSKDTLLSYVAFLPQEGLKHQTIKCYLSVIQHFQIAASMPDIFLNANFPYLGYILLRIKKTISTVRLSAGFAPPLITNNSAPPAIILVSKLIVPKCSGQPVAWANLHFSVQESLQLYQTVNQTFSTCLTPGNIAIDNHSSPKTMRVRIKQSKADPFRAEINIYLGHTYAELRLCCLTWREREQSGPSIQV